MSYTILGTGHCVPDFVLNNEMLSEMVDTSDAWIQSRTGMKERHICTTESLTDLAETAARRALRQASLLPEQLDFILCSTIEGDFLTPSLSCMVQQRLGASCPAMDINAACSGFIYALDAAAGYFARGTARHILVIAAECMSKHTDWEDRATCVLFGDGAGAVVLGPGDDLLAVTLQAAGNTAFLNIPGKTSAFPLAPKQNPQKQTLYMHGQEVYRFAVQAMCRSINDALAAAGLTMAQVRYVFVHQANRRILEAAQSRLGIEDDKMIMMVDRFGNTSSASVPIILDITNREQKLRPGDIIALCAFGGGLTAGAAVLRWSQPTPSPEEA